MQRALLLVAALLCVPTAHAGRLQGEGLVLGDMSLPPDAAASGLLLGAYGATTDALDTFVLRAPLLEVDRMSARYIELDVGGDRIRTQIAFERATFLLHDATAALSAGDPTGWLGLHGEGGVGTTRAADGASVSAHEAMRLGNGEVRDEPVRPNYYQIVEESVAVVAGRADIDYSGGGWLKFSGLDVEVRSAENVSSLATGVSSPEPGIVDVSWAVLRFEEASANVGGLDAAVLAYDSAELGWTGACTFRLLPIAPDAAPGTQGSGEPTLLMGTFSAVVDPRPLGQEMAMALRFDGEPLRDARLASTTLTPRGPQEATWVALALIVAGCIAVGIALRRRTAQRELPADELATLATAAADSGDLRAALSWTRLARSKSPTSLRLALDEAYFLAAGGDLAAALAACDAAAPLDPYGERHVLAARLLDEAGSPQASVIPHVAAALAASPLALLEFETDPQFAGLLRSPALRDAVARARADLGA